MKGPIFNAVTVDVEDYFQVSAFAPYIDRDKWSGFECRIERNMNRILKMFDSADVKGTFFILGWVAERYPSLLRQISDLGHEIGSHGFSHIQVSAQDAAGFRQDVDRTKKILEDITGSRVCGYRAASFSIAESNTWAHDILASTGHRYSSSLYPIRHDRYGRREASRFPRPMGNSGLVELPVTTVEIGGLRLPCGGGGYFRLFPYAWSKWAIQRVNHRDGESAIFYFHPWELDSGQPRIDGLDWLSKFRHYVNLGRFEGKLTRLLRDFHWTTIRRAFSDVI